MIAGAAMAVAACFLGKSSLDARERRDDGRRFEAPVTGGYHSTYGIRDLLQSWAEADPERLRATLIGDGGAGSIPVLEVMPSLEAGDGASDPLTVLIAGAVDARSAIGTEAVLGTVHGILEHLDRLPPHVHLVVTPTCAPQMTDRVAEGGQPDGRVHATRDDDRDGEVDEDGPDDVDGDGQILEMLIEDPAGAWCLDRDGRALRRAREQDAPRYRRLVEGRDDDGDGRYNEDGAAGVELARHFPVGWSGPDDTAGLRPLSDPTLRAFALWIGARRPSLALLFGGHHGGVLLHPGDGVRDADGAMADSLGAIWSRTTGRMGTGGAVGRRREGAIGDWLAAVLGTVSVEVAAWGPGVVGLDGRPLGPVAESVQDMPGDAAAQGDEAAWRRWVDEVRGGVGLVAWHPVDLGGGVTGLVGGWEPRTRWNPPEAQLEAALLGVDRFVEEVLAGLPRLEIDVLEAEREGRLVEITVQVTNRGELPTSILDGGGADETVGGLELRIQAPCDISLLAGTPVVMLEDGLVAHGSSRRVTWLLHVEPGATLEVEARGPGGLRVTRELRP